MEFSLQQERKRRKRPTKFEDVERSLPKPKPKPSVDLPFDVVVSILTRLPARHLRRMRSVCKSWSLLISDNRFIREHLKFRSSVTKRPYIASLHRSSGSKIGYKMKLFPEEGDYHHEFDMINNLVGDKFCIMSNSCDGLICVVGVTFTYLVNPSIQKVRALPEIFGQFDVPGILSAGLGFNDSTGEYKVVRLFHNKVGQKEHIGCGVYTFGSLHSPSCWKVIGCPPFEPSCYSLPVFVNGAIHWDVSNGREIALSFDVKSEKFDVILHPVGSSWPPCSRLLELGGLLCLAYTRLDEMQMDIWVLKDYNNREWIKQHSIDLSSVHGYWKGIAISIKSVIIHDGKIFFCSGRGGRHYYDLHSRSFVKHTHFSTDSVYVHDTAYTESIMWPVFFSDTM